MNETWASLSCAPSALDLASRSEPARSTRCSVPCECCPTAPTRDQGPQRSAPRAARTTSEAGPVQVCRAAAAVARWARDRGKACPPPPSLLLPLPVSLLHTHSKFGGKGSSALRGSHLRRPAVLARAGEAEGEHHVRAAPEDDVSSASSMTSIVGEAVGGRVVRAGAGGEPSRAVVHVRLGNRAVVLARGGGFSIPCRQRRGGRRSDPPQKRTAALTCAAFMRRVTSSEDVTGASSRSVTSKRPCCPCTMR
jgi:hypothetical protein